ncbi:hypothetical protein [Streptomyces resistomycificus]|uniref:Secreted protein n=2 Tax=Streptomyces resistomycificus TaxID=67356 RepID=A0A0L8LNZ4_9ACTN|nr:hypothetical protein [Streptomyces resistomycificus]KOG39810.1 hypothetical protein ADK37_08365 [Streptomyces resistomycificus]KUO00852.1 hypothetical protein AQJ84_07645 [Streptomyces resistomycificus]
MKKRSMLAIASLATGFVVAAVSPSHSAEELGDLDVDKTLSALDQTIASDSLAGVDKAALGQNG